jgi:hypothetical protein
MANHVEFSLLPLRSVDSDREGNPRVYNGPQNSDSTLMNKKG